MKVLKKSLINSFIRFPICLKRKNEKWEMKQKKQMSSIFFQKRTDSVKTLETTALTVQ